MAEEGTSRKKVKMDDELIDVTGYIHNMSEIKISQKNNNYFTCVVQTENEVLNLVCLSADKFKILKKAEREDIGVFIKNVRCQLENRRKKLFLNYVGLVTNCVEKLAFEKREQLKDEEELKDIEIIDLATKPVDVCAYYSIRGKVINVGKAVEVTVYGNRKKSQNVVLTDGNHKFNVSLYGDLVDKMQVGKSYRLKNVCLRSVNNVKKISARRQTELEEIEYDLIGSIYDVGKNDTDEEVVELDIIGVKCELKIKCPICGNAYDQATIKHCNTVRCIKCDMLTKRQKLSSCMTSRIDGTDENGRTHKLTIYDCVMQEMLTKENRSELLSDCKGLEEYLIEQNEKMVIILDNSNVKEISF